jgi:EAL domain-containing protein (putative c-di-GMP-specific phosphodiesterase class I)
MVAIPMHNAPPYSFAFQPIVHAARGEVVSQEALIRGLNDEPAKDILDAVAGANLHPFDLASRIAAIALGQRLGIGTLNLNFLARSPISDAAAIRTTLQAAARCGYDPGAIVLEVSEAEAIDDPLAFSRLLQDHRAAGMRVAIDDFGAGHSGLNLLADFQPDMIKLDMKLVRGIDHQAARQSIVRALLAMCGELGIEVVAEGVETLPEFRWFEAQGVQLFQGYLFARPAFEAVAVPQFPASD